MANIGDIVTVGIASSSMVQNSRRTGHVARRDLRARGLMPVRAVACSACVRCCV